MTSLELQSPNPPSVRLFGWAEAGILVAALAILHVAADYNYVLFHTLVELERILVMGGIFVLAWHTRAWASNAFLLILGIAVGCIAVLELLHTLAYKGVGLFDGYGANLPTQLWIAFRIVESLSVLAGALWLGRRVNAGMVLGGYAALSVLIAAIVFGGWFPDCFVEGQGLTPFKIAAEYVILGIFLASALALYVQRRHFEPKVLVLTISSILVGALSEIAFTQYANVFGKANQYGHYLLLISAYLLYRAVLVTGLISPFGLLFREVKQRERDLEALVLERTAHLRESQALNAAFLENSPAAIYLTDAANRCTLANPAFERLTGRPRNDILGRTVFDLFEPDLAEAMDRRDQLVRTSGRSMVTTETVHSGDKELLFEVVRFPLIGPDGRLAGSGGIATDITDIRAAERRYGMMIRTSMDAIVLFDDAGSFIEANEATQELTGYSAEQLQELTLSDIEASMSKAEIRQTMQRIRGDGMWRFDSRWRRSDGTIRDVEVSATHLRQNGAACFLCFVRDITEKKAAAARIEHLAHFDQLTGLPNRLLFSDQVDAELARATEFGLPRTLIYLDVDNFKVINDTLGHAVGDALLCEVAGRLKQLVNGNGLVCRFSGDEFVILVDCRNQPPAQFVERLLSLVAQPLHIEQHDLATTVSVGAAVFPHDGRDFNTLFKKADTAVFAAKAGGRNTYRFFDETMQAQSAERLNLLNALRGALSRQELSLHYQPQFDLRTGVLTGAEALLRWNHPDLGMVPPGRFIPLAEDSGLIIPIGDWVLREACRQAVAWQQAGLPPFSVAVNLSAVQFRQNDFRRTVVDVLAETGLDPRWLELELTESLLISDAEGVLTTVGQLKALGLRMSIDDFGTGYSSLSYLKRFAVDKLKIDQSFVRGMQDEGDDAALVRAIIQMAHELGIKTIAEGVETAEIAERLARFRCEEVQGYHFGRPMPAEQFFSFVSACRETAE